MATVQRCLIGHAFMLFSALLFSAVAFGGEVVAPGGGDFNPDENAFDGGAGPEGRIGASSTATGFDNSPGVKAAKNRFGLDRLMKASDDEEIPVVFELGDFMTFSSLPVALEVDPLPKGPLNWDILPVTARIAPEARLMLRVAAGCSLGVKTRHVGLTVLEKEGNDFRVKKDLVAPRTVLSAGMGEEVFVRATIELVLIEESLTKGGCRGLAGHMTRVGRVSVDGSIIRLGTRPLAISGKSLPGDPVEAEIYLAWSRNARPEIVDVHGARVFLETQAGGVTIARSGRFFFQVLPALVPVR